MQTENIVVDRAEARALYRKYREHQHYSTPLDWEIQRTYQLIAQGRLVIRAVNSIIAAGLNDEGLPKLAIVRADVVSCRWKPNRWGGGEFRCDVSWHARRRHHSRFLPIPNGTWPVQDRYLYKDLVAQAPLIPIHLRPKRGLQNYHVLFEAEWREVVPVDPILLRRIGQSDLWVVCAAWDLTEVERAVLAGRIT